MANLGSALLSDDYNFAAQSERASFFNSLSKMMDSYAPTQFEPEKVSRNNSTVDAIPFDSPLDQSLGSPASTRDFSNSPFHTYEFDFGGVEDSIMFPDHGTQEMHSGNYLAGLPLFNDNLVKNETTTVAFPTASQQKEEMDRINKANACDFSFDAMTHGVIPTSTTTTNAMDVPSPTASIASSTTDGFESINQLAAVFVREYARSHPLNDLDVLLRALRVAGIAVSDQVVTEILASTSVKSISTSPSPASSPSSSQGHSCCDHQHAAAISAPVSPLSLPSADSTSFTPKTRSSMQSSSRDNLIIDTRYGKRFVCSVCNKHFDRAFNLRTHAMTHIDPDDRDKPFLCPWSECGKNFSRKYDAERHYRSVHLKKGEVATKQQVLMALSGRQHQDSDDDDDSPSNG
jgi:hypothetical protein